MGKIVYFVAASFDGFIADKEGGIDWLFTDGDYGYSAFLKSVDALLMGRRTYDKILEFGSYPYADKQSFVFSRQKKPDTNNIRFFNNFIPDHVEKLRQSTKGNIWFLGGGEISSRLFEHGLIDQIIISLHPIFLGEGIPLCNSIKLAANFRFEDHRHFSSGLTQITCNSVIPQKTITATDS